MSTAWTDVKTTGSGRIGARLVICGMPQEAVTNASMSQEVSPTLNRVHGLLMDGIVLEERIDPARATCEVSPFTATIVDVTDTNTEIGTPWTKLFSQRPTARCWLTVTATDLDTTINVTDTSAFPANGTFYIDQETITYTSKTSTQFLGCTRGDLRSLATWHYALDTALTRAAEVTDWPLTMEGRHVLLYTYAEQDDPLGDGTLVWTGILSTDARLGSDGCSWDLSVDPITRIFAGPMGGDLTSPLPARGVFYPYNASFFIQVAVSSDATANNAWGVTPAWHANVSGFFETQDLFVAAVQAKIDANATTIATGLGLKCVSNGTPGFHFELTTPSASPRWISLYAWSPVDNLHSAPRSAGEYMLALDGTVIAGASGVGGSVTTSTTYVYPQFAGSPAIPGLTGVTTYTSAVQAPGSVPRGSFTSVSGYFPIEARYGAQFYDSSAISSAPANRIYVGGTADIGSIGTVAIDLGSSDTGSDASGGTITAGVTPDTTGRFFDCPSETGPSAQAFSFAGTSLPAYTPARAYLSGGTLRDLRAALINASTTGAPVGSAPYLYDVSLSNGTVLSSDFGSWSAVDSAAAGRSIALRGLTTSKALKLGDVLYEEAKNLGCFFALDSTGRIEVYQLGVSPTGASWTIDSTNELTDEGPSGWERNGLGSVAEIIVKTGYDHTADKYVGPTYTFHDVTAYGRNPAAQPITIAPKSVQYSIGFGTPADVLDDYAAISSLVFGLFAYPYDMVTVQVPMTLFGALCGDNVLITSKNLPSGSGDRGMVARNGLIVGRRWNLATGEGTLTLICTEIDYAGYTPTGRVSAQVDNGGNNWTITIATPAAGTSTAGYSPATDFAVNDVVRVVLYDSTTSTTVSGTVTSTNGVDKITVQFGAVWTPSTSTWNVEYDLASTPWQTTQQVYCALANGTTDLITYTSTRAARQFAP